MLSRLWNTNTGTPPGLQLTDQLLELLVCHVTVKHQGIMSRAGSSTGSAAAVASLVFPGVEFPSPDDFSSFFCCSFLFRCSFFFSSSCSAILGTMCYNSESTISQRPAGSVCAHAGDGRPYLAQGSSMQYIRRKQTRCACETVVRRERESIYKQGRIYLICWPNASKTGNHNTHHLL